MQSAPHSNRKRARHESDAVEVGVGSAAATRAGLLTPSKPSGPTSPGDRKIVDPAQASPFRTSRKASSPNLGASPLTAAAGSTTPGSGKSKPQKRHITWIRGENKTSYVPVPKKSEVKDFWFTPHCFRVTKPLTFTIDDADDETALDIGPDGKMKINTLTAPRRSATELAEAAARGRGGLGQGKMLGGPRSTLEICCDDSLDRFLFMGQKPSRKQTAEQWIALGSSTLGTTVKVGALLGPGAYRLRCIGAGPIVVTAEVSEVVEKLA
jgi:hypothetical protein